MRARSYALALSILVAGTSARALDFATFETGPVRPLARSADGSRLFAVNIPANQLEIFDVTDIGLIRTAAVPVGMEPCAVAVAPDGKVWVVNHLSDSVSIVDVNASPPRVMQTLLVGDEPRDIVFAGTIETRAFITTAHRGQHRTDSSISAVPGAGDPKLTAASGGALQIGRADVWVFNAAAPGTALGGSPLAILSFFADTPRALAVSPLLDTVYVAAFHSGNQTTAILESTVCDGLDPNTPCGFGGGSLSAPGGIPGPVDNFFGAAAPETGLMVKLNQANGQWEDSLSRDWSDFVRFNLPDKDVFAFSPDTLDPNAAQEFEHVGTILFNMAVNPVSGKVYVSNIESPNHVRFEGKGDHGGSTVQGHLSETRIAVLTDPNTIVSRHLNKHILYDELFTDPNGQQPDPNQIQHSLATPLEMVFSSDGTTLYVAAFGSAKIGVFSTAAIDNNTFSPTLTSANYIPTGGGPSGLILDEALNRLYVMTRFDNSLAVINLADKTTVQTVPLHNPEPPEVVEGRPFLYDAVNTSGNGEASCASCHIFADFDSLIWNLGDPDAGVSTNNQPLIPGSVGGDPNTFHPMKGPMTTQTLRGLSTHGAMHWRGDRADGFFGTDSCTEPSGAPCNEDRAFRNFIVATEGLVGKQGILDPNDMQKFADFALQILPPPNPVRPLNNTLTGRAAAGAALYPIPGTDSAFSCNSCHVLDPSQGFFGTNGFQTFEGEPQNFKIAQLRNAYSKVGMFGLSFVVNPGGFQLPHTGDQVRGAGFLHDGAVDTLQSFLGSSAFTLNSNQILDLEEFVLQFDSDLAPIVGQQATLTATNQGVVDPRVDLLIQQANTAFSSLVLGGSVRECELIVKGTVGGSPRGWVRESDGTFSDDVGGTSISEATVRSLATDAAPLTYTCVPPGSGQRIGINRDGDALLDGLDNCVDAANSGQLNTDGDAQGDACDQDDDDDNLLDVYETGTGVFVSAINTGSDPLLVDTDGDGASDGAEVAAGTNPNDPLSVLPPIPLLPGWSALALAGSLLVMTWLGRRRQRNRASARQA